MYAIGWIEWSFYKIENTGEELIWKGGEMLIDVLSLKQ